MVATIIVLASVFVVMIILMTDRQVEPLRAPVELFGLKEFPQVNPKEIDERFLDMFGPKECYHHAFTPYSFTRVEGDLGVSLEFVCESCGAELHINGQVVALPPTPTGVITFNGTATVSGAKDGSEPTEPREG
jgi:hypothetical protein